MKIDGFREHSFVKYLLSIVYQRSCLYLLAHTSTSSHLAAWEAILIGNPCNQAESSF